MTAVDDAETTTSTPAPAQPAGQPADGSSKGYDAHFRVWRGDAEGGELVDYTVQVNEGEVVLDIIHRLQATQAGDLAVRWNCKAGKCGSCSAEINGRPRLMCMTRMSTFTRGRGRHGDAAAHVPGDEGPGHRRVLQLQEGAGGAGVRAAARIRAGLVPHGAGRRLPLAGVPQVHRVLLVPGRLPRDPRPRGQQGVLLRSSVPDAHRRAGHAPAGCAGPPAHRSGRARARHVQHHQVLHRGLPRTHQDHRQRAHPAQGTRRRPQVRPAGVAR